MDSRDERELERRDQARRIELCDRLKEELADYSTTEQIDALVNVISDMDAVDLLVELLSEVRDWEWEHGKTNRP